jgi:hypothetical protein
MSGTLLIMFKKGEIKKIKEWFRKICPEDRFPDLPVPKCPSREDIERGLYVEFKNNIMSFDYAIWDSTGSAFAYAIAKELYKRNKIKKMGWDSVGYCDFEDLYYLQDKSELIRPNPIFEEALERFESVNLDETNGKYYDTEEKQKTFHEFLKQEVGGRKATIEIFEKEAKRLVELL